MTVVWPGYRTLITPPQAQLSLQLLSTIGSDPLRTVGTPGTQGATVTGTQGIGVNTPRAAAVAAATVGLETLVHMPNGGTFTIGALCMMLAEGGPGVSMVVLGITTRLDGATPNVHIMVAPMHTAIPTKAT